VDALKRGIFSCRVPGKHRDRLYYFKVHLLGPDGSPGPPSNRTRVDPGSAGE
jgi:hypothetical protein